ncbi:MAG: DUF420 domain-containing protein [Sulfurimonadaceae bacterium]|nr:DUF420 domain-containing protein [Sulfurimonadaceae bacterium]
MFEQGFLGTGAPLYLDIVTIYFAILPFLLFGGIAFAINRNHEMHYKMQLSTFLLTLVMVVIFELGMRMSGGFGKYMEDVNINETFMFGFLIFHILIALISVVLWTILIYSAVKEYKLQHEPIVKSHKKLGMIVYAGMSMTSFTGILIYYFLFMH